MAAGLSDAQVAAAQVRGVVSHQSAALLLGLGVAVQPDRPVTVPRHRHLVRARANVHWANVGADESIDGVTTALRTVIDCARTLPFGEALVIADSALTRKKSPEASSGDAAAGGSGPWSCGCHARRRGCRLACGESAESLVRALTLEAGMQAVLR